MNTFSKALCALILAVGAVASAPAFGHGRVHFGFFFGGPIGFPAPYYYYPPPPVYYYPPPAPVYIEQPAQAAPAAQTDNSWYFCRDSQAYYPYVKECASQWQRVAPRPSGS